MSKAKPKIIAILGPTSSGKSDVAIKLAKKFNGEIISADSRQVFRGMDLGTGKVSGNFDEKGGAFVSDGIPHYLIDVVDPMEEFNVSHFQKTSSIAVGKIISSGKLPIVCGGTNFWINAFINNISLPEVKPDQKLRSMLRNKKPKELFEILGKLDPQRSKSIDPQNPLRLVRAIEIAKALGCVPELKKQCSPYDCLRIAIDIPWENLKVKIGKRLDERLAQGMVAEVEKLLKDGTAPEWLEKIGLEYRWVTRYLQGNISLDNMRKRLFFDIIHFAKRQMTWLKKEPQIHWVRDYASAENEVTLFLEK